MTELLSERANKIFEYMETHMISPCGLVYHTINENTHSAWRDAEIPDNVIYNCIDAPRELWKAGFFNYEDSLMATSEYLIGNLYQYFITHNRTHAEIAKRCFDALKLSAEHSARYEGENVSQPTNGFLSKPYGGANKANLSGEVSIDQYMRTMYAMEFYRDSIASSDETKWINRFLFDCSRCWDMYNYSFNYFKAIVRWATERPHGLAFGLYCSAIGQQMKKYDNQYWFELFLTRLETFQKKIFSGLLTDNTAALVVMAMKQLCKFRAQQKDIWTDYCLKAVSSAEQAVQNGYGWLFSFLSNQQREELIEPHWHTQPHRYWNFLRWRGNIKRPAPSLSGAMADTYEITEQQSLIKKAYSILEDLGKDGYIKWAEPITENDLPKGYEMLGQCVSGLNTACWFRSYWQLRFLMHSRNA